MSIEKKFNKFSTKEWIQYLQYKLSPEREKELEAQTLRDPFLKEAIDTMGDKDNRPIAYQSMSYLINVVEQGTGVSESNIAKAKTEPSVGSSSINPKLVLGAIVGILVIGLIAFGIYYLLNNSSNSDVEETMTEAETVSETQLYADSSAMPLETLPMGNQVKPDTIKLTNPVSAATKPSGNKSSYSNSSQEQNGTRMDDNTSNVITSTPISSGSSVSSKEREMFNQAQEQFKQGNREEAKRILKELNGYDNPMKSKAESILKNMEN